nr:hypothetical protein GCM10020093_026400 [Planobispora longispora]
MDWITGMRAPPSAPARAASPRTDRAPRSSVPLPDSASLTTARIVRKPSVMTVRAHQAEPVAESASGEPYTVK